MVFSYFRISELQWDECFMSGFLPEYTDEHDNQMQMSYKLISLRSVYYLAQCRTFLQNCSKYP
jgi:hypothetical protein